MFISMFLKKIIFFSVTGAAFVYLLVFHTPAQTTVKEKPEMACQSLVKNMNYNRVQTLRENDRISIVKAPRLIRAEQNALKSYFKALDTDFVSRNREHFFEVSTYIYQSSARKILGYKVVVDQIDDQSNEATYFLTKQGQILFTHIDSYKTVNKWNCENFKPIAVN